MSQTRTPRDDAEESEQVPAGDPRAGLISIDPERLGGEPCFAGTRVPVCDLWDYLAGGETLDIFLACFPTVSREQTILAIHMAASALTGRPYKRGV